MPLIRIEVCDFKSYRGHQVIGPFRNFSSVIGPNGAGKSNLMDAISFVLGVKSAQLRSSQLKDLVYRGRKLARDSNGDASASGDVSLDVEQGQGEEEGEGTAKKAWVLAVYEDEKGKEWRFQRTISMTGASEYKLNDRVVTYSVYNTSLTSHNILVKAKNFLVFQGDVEAVASQSPKDLSRLIEQISGSLELAREYEEAKAEQEKATENATFNFTKRRGIAGEIKQYKEQKTEADKFEALCQERDDLILRRILFKLFHIEEALERNAREIKDQARTLEGLREEQRVHDEELADARAEQAKARSNAMRKERALKSAERAVEGKKPDLVTTEGQIAHSTRKIRNAETTLGQIARDKEARELVVKNHKRDLKDVQKAAGEAQEEQRRLSSDNMSLSQESLEEYRRLKAQASVLAVEERQSLEILLRDEKTAARTFAQLNDKQEELERKKTKLQEELGVQGGRKGELEVKVGSLQGELDKVKQELDNQQAERTRIARLETEISEKLQDVHNKLLQANVDQRESERDARMKETLATLQRIFPGVRGRLVDLCKPTQRKYETAISVVLGRNIDAVVVDEEKTAIDCIEYMRNQRAGQATFIPLDTIQVKPINDKYRAFAKGARLAVDVIQFDAAVERAMHHACGNALVCDTIEVAKYVCWERGQEVKAVSLEGTIIHKSGLITGGRSSHDGSKKWDEKDLQGLHRVRDTLHSQLSELLKSKPRNKADESLLSEITRLESELVVARDDLAACKLRVTGLKDELKHVDRSIKQDTPELNKARKALDSLRGKVQELESVVNVEEDAIFEDFCSRIGVANIREYEQRQLRLAQEEGEARLRYDTQIARLMTQLKFEEDQLATINSRIANYEATVTTETANIERLNALKAQIEEEIATMEEEIEGLKEELKELNAELEEKTKEVEKVKKTSMKAGKALDQMLKEITTKNDDIEKLGLERSALYRKCRLDEIKLPLLEGSLRNVPMEENLREEVAMDVDEEEGATVRPKQINNYGVEVDFEVLDDDDREDPSGDSLADYDSSIAKLNQDIERMAPNLKAIERLDDVESKLKDTEREAERARKESKDARDHFTDVKRRRTELFNKAYNHISERIDQVYKDLTKGKASPMGGVAYLSLEDNEEPYASGIKYHAMPPMKRFRDMEQLSGGEKTVAALALLFAIHSYQPSPFFVLDEVDAALDNTNVAKVARYIRSQASDAFQFIVISLKGSLYEHGDSLVGIYRDQEVNSSRTLTLDLTQYDGQT